MQFFFALGLLSGLAAAQSSTAGLISQLPACAVSCIEKAATSIGCASTDIACLCKSQEKLVSTLTPCVLTAGCSSDEIAQAAKLAPQICAQAGTDPAASDLAAASSLVAGATAATATATGTAATSSASPAAAPAVRQTTGYLGIIGAGVAALAAAAL